MKRRINPSPITHKQIAQDQQKSGECDDQTPENITAVIRYSFTFVVFVLAPAREADNRRAKIRKKHDVIRCYI